MSDAVPVITLDGPSGSGKGTIARELAEQLGWHRLDSGALYRVTALAATRAGVPLDQAPALARLARGLAIRFDGDGGGPDRIWLGGADVGAEIRGEDCGAAASRIAALPEVRAALVDLQRGFRQAPGLVADGRDMGTVIFPDAALKIFLTASAEERARRRHKQLKEQGVDVSLAALSAEITERDARDSAREVAPLKPADDAITVDTTGTSIAEVVDRLMSLARAAFPRADES